MKKIQTGDLVYVVAGKWKGTTSKVLSIGQKKNAKTGDWVVVKGVNVVKKAKKGEGFIEFEKPIHVSNVMCRDEKSKSPSRVGFRQGKKGKERYLKKSGIAL